MSCLPAPITVAPAPHRPLPERYCPVPERLLHDLHDTPFAVGVYALIGRLYLINQLPIALSRADIARFDPAAKPGAITRAFDRLVARGWLLVDTQGCKHRYTPSWGMVRGVSVPWIMGVERLGRPHHLRRLALDVTLLDTCMGKLTPHPTLAATIARYLTTPALSLRDVGAYALTLAGIPHPTPRLAWLGLVHDQVVCPVPATATLLALCSQRALAPDPTSHADAGLTIAGARRLGVHLQPAASGTTPQPLFFLPNGLIGSQILNHVGIQIGDGDRQDGGRSAVAPEQTPIRAHPTQGTWDDQVSKDQLDPTPPRSHASAGGGGKTVSKPHEHKRPSPDMPDTEAVQLLRALGVLPAACIRHATTPLDQVRAAIASARARTDVRNVAGWVVSLLDQVITHGYQIPQVAQESAVTPPPVVVPDDQTDALPDEAAVMVVKQTAPDARGDCVVYTDEVIAVSSLDLTAHVQSELCWRVGDRTARAAIDGLRVSETPSAVTICCTNASHRTVLERIRPLLQTVLSETGRTQPLRMVLTCSTPRPMVACEAARPAWIAQTIWDTLPPLLRAALAGSSLTNTGVCAVSPALTAMIQQRYTAELAMLVGEAQQVPCPVS